MSERKILDGQREAWEEVDSLVLECQSHNTDPRRRDELLQELLIRFEPFLNMFRDLLLEDKIYLNNKVSREFIGLYIANKYLRSKVFKNWHLNKDEYAEVNRSLSLIRDNYAKQCDVEQDLKTLFSTMVMKYKKTNRSFNAYLTYVFRYELFRFIQAHLKDRINNSYDRSDMNDIGVSNMSSLTMHKADLLDQIVVDDDGNFSELWINGEVCNDLFSHLTPIERLILAMVYAENAKPVEIANKIGVDIQTYRKIRRGALNKLEKLTGKDINRRKKRNE